MKYNVVNPFKYKGIDYAKGEEVDLPDHAAKTYGNAGFVEATKEEKFVEEKAKDDKKKK